MFVLNVYKNKALLIVVLLISILLVVIFQRVEQCGRPTQARNCSECNMPIGGTGHQLAQGNVAAQR